MATESIRARVLIEIRAGVIPGTPMPEYTKQFAVDSDAWYVQGKWEGKPDLAQFEVLKVYGIANEYARTMWNPQKVNWVELTWIYL